MDHLVRDKIPYWLWRLIHSYSSANVQQVAFQGKSPLSSALLQTFTIRNPFLLYFFLPQWLIPFAQSIKIKNTLMTPRWWRSNQKDYLKVISQVRCGWSQNKSLPSEDKCVELAVHKGKTLSCPSVRNKLTLSLRNLFGTQRISMLQEVIKSRISQQKGRTPSFGPWDLGTLGHDLTTNTPLKNRKERW